MGVCDYPVCDEPSIGSRGIVMQPEHIMVNLCQEHADALDANRVTPETRDFWRWFNAMSGLEG